MAKFLLFLNLSLLSNNQMSSHRTILFEISNLLFSIIEKQLSLSAPQILSELSHIHLSIIRPRESALSCHLIVLPLSLELVPIRKEVHAFTLFHTLFPSAFIPIPSVFSLPVPPENTSPVLLTLLPLAFILISIAVCVDSNALLHTVNKLSFIQVAVFVKILT